MAKRKKHTAKTTDERTLTDKHNFLDDDFHAAEDAAKKKKAVMDAKAAEIAEDDKSEKPPKDMEQSAFMHRLNMLERCRKNLRRPYPPEKIMKRIDGAFSAGEYEECIKLCNTGWWGRKATKAEMGGKGAQIRAVMKAQEEWFAEHPMTEGEDADNWRDDFEKRFGKFDG